MALKFITAEEAASFVHHNDNVGFSGFTPAGCPKVVPGAIAKKQLPNMKRKPVPDRYVYRRLDR